MSTLILDKLKQDNTYSINIYYSKINDVLIKNTKRILNIENINISLK